MCCEFQRLRSLNAIYYLHNIVPFNLPLFLVSTKYRGKGCSIYSFCAKAPSACVHPRPHYAVGSVVTLWFVSQCPEVILVLREHFPYFTEVELTVVVFNALKMSFHGLLASRGLGSEVSRNVYLLSSGESAFPSGSKLSRPPGVSTGGPAPVSAFPCVAPAPARLRSHDPLGWFFT